MGCRIVRYGLPSFCAVQCFVYLHSYISYILQLTLNVMSPQRNEYNTQKYKMPSYFINRILFLLIVLFTHTGMTSIAIAEDSGKPGDLPNAEESNVEASNDSIAKIADSAIIEDLNSVSPLAKFSHWKVYKDVSGKTAKCHAVSHPVSTKYFHGIRNMPYSAVSIYESGDLSFSTYPGFIISGSAAPIINIGSKNFALMVLRERYAATYSAFEDKKMLPRILALHTFSVRSDNARSTRIAFDTYSTTGLEEAIQYMKNQCIMES